MIRYIWLFDLNGDEAARHRSESWYEQVHAPEVRAARGTWLRGYRSWYSLDAQDEGLRPYDYRVTEMDFDDLGPQPIDDRYTQYPGQADDLGVTQTFYSRTESFHHSARKPPTAILVEGDDAPPAGKARELLLIALSDESAEELERLEQHLLARPSALRVRMHRAIRAEEDTPPC